MDLALLRRGTVALAGLLLTVFAQKARADALSEAGHVQSALAAMHDWVGPGENGRRWRVYLMSDRIQQELERASVANPQALDGPIARYRSQVPGLDRPRFAAVRTALATWQQSLQADAEADLAELAQAAGEQFVPVAPSEVDAARGELADRVRKLDAYLSGGGENGQNWKEYLLLDELQSQLAAEGTPDFSVLARVFRRFRAIHEGLELPVFADVAPALEHYVNLANIARVEDQSRVYSRQLELLAEDLRAYESEPTDELAFNVGRRLEFVDALGRARRFVQAIRRRLARPNLRAQVAADLLTSAIGQDVRDTRHVTDVILGTYISGPATTDARLTAQTASSGEAARIDFLLQGNVHSNTVGRNGPVQIYSSAVTPFHSFKSIYFDRYGFRDQSACTNASTCSDIHCIQPVKSGIGSRLVEKIAWKRASQQKGQAEAVAADHAEVRISRSFNDRLASLLAEAQVNYNRNFRLPLVRRNEFPQLFDVRSTSDGITLTMLQANRAQLGAASPPPQPQGRYDMSLAMHESLANNLAGAWLAGYRLTDDWIRDRVRRRGGEVPPELQEDQEPWSITFVNQRPVTVTFSDGGFVATVRGQQFSSGSNVYGAMNITARYQFESTDDGVLLRRRGDLEIFPPGFMPGTDRLTAEQSALREVLIRRLGEVLKPEIRGEGIELPGELSRAGRLLPVEASSDGGWLLLGWNRARERTVLAERAEDSVVSNPGSPSPR